MTKFQFYYLGVLTGAIITFICWVGVVQKQSSAALKNDSLMVAHSETEKAISLVDSLEKSEAIRSKKIDSIINKKYENIPLSFFNYRLDSLQREQLRTIQRLDKRKCPY